MSDPPEVVSGVYLDAATGGPSQLLGRRILDLLRVEPAALPNRTRRARRPVTPATSYVVAELVMIARVWYVSTSRVETT